MASDNEKLYELHDQLAEKAAQMDEALAEAGVLEAEDSTGQVLARLTGDDLDISVGTFWRTSITPAELAGVVMTTVTRVRAAQLEAWSKAFSDDPPQVAARPVPSATSVAHEIGDIVESVDGDTFHRNVNRFIETFTSNLNASIAVITERAHQTHIGSDSQTRIELDAAGNIIGITFDENWLQSADGGRVTESLGRAIAAARKSAEDATPRHPFDGTPLADYAEGIADPTTLIRMLAREG